MFAMSNAPVEEKKQEPSQQATSFAQQAEQAPPGLVAEFWDFLIHNKKWWLTPIILVLIMFGVLIALASNAAVAPFIYNMF